MILSLADVLGLPPGWPDPVYDVAAFRYLLLALSVLWAALIARGRPVLGLLAGILFVQVALAFWVLGWQRPYGLLVDQDATRTAAQTSVTAFAGTAAGSFLVGEPAAPDPGLSLAGVGVPAEYLLLLPTLLPFVIASVLGVLIQFLWASRREAPLAAMLWLAFSTGEPDALHGMGFVSQMFSRPGQSLALVIVVAAVFLLSRLRVRGALPIVTGVAILGAWLLSPASSSRPGPAVTLLLLTVDQGFWLPLGLFGLYRAPDVAARALAAAGPLLLAGVACGAPVDPWLSHGLYRLGLVLLAAHPLVDLAARAGGWLAKAGPRAWRTAPPAGLGAAALLLVTLPGSFLTWWDPARLDPAALASREPITPVLMAAMDWIRHETAPGSVFLASPDYAPAVASLGGRRVLRAPSLAVTADEEVRVRAERILTGRDAGRLARRYGVTHVFIAPGDFLKRGVRSPEELESLPYLKLRYVSPERLRVYEVTP